MKFYLLFKLITIYYTDIEGGVANRLNVLIVYICVMYIEIDVIYFCNAIMHEQFIKMAVINCFNQNDLVVTLECIIYVIYNIALSLKR